MALAEVGRGIPGLSFVEVEDDDLCAVLGEESRGPTPNSTRRCGSRDDTNLVR